MNKQTILTTAVLVFAAAAIPAYADDAITAANNHLSIQTGLSDLSYVEHDNAHHLSSSGGATLDSERADLPAFRAELSRQGCVLGIDNIYTSLGVSVAAGSTHYSGYSFTLDGTNKLAGADEYHHVSAMVDVDLKLGKAYRVLPKLQLTPYLRYDFNYWARSSIESYMHHELGLGLLGQYAVTPKLVVSVDASMSAVFDGSDDTHGGVSENLAPRAAQNIALTADYAVSHRLHVLASYSFRHFSYGRSSTVTGNFEVSPGVYEAGDWFEPSSSTTTNQFMVGVSYNY
jgi:hypothetical protein